MQHFYLCVHIPRRALQWPREGMFSILTKLDQLHPAFHHLLSDGSTWQILTSHSEQYFKVYLRNLPIPLHKEVTRIFVSLHGLVTLWVITRAHSSTTRLTTLQRQGKRDHSSVPPGWHPPGAVESSWRCPKPSARGEPGCPFPAGITRKKAGFRAILGIPSRLAQIFTVVSPEW